MEKMTKRSSSSGEITKLHTETEAPSPCEPAGTRTISRELREFIEQTRADAFAANDCVLSLLEMLHGCPPGHQVSAGRLVALLALVQAYLANVVDGLAVETGPA